MIDYVELKSENSDANTLLCIHTTPLDKNYFLHNLKNIKLMMNIILIDLPNHGNSITFKDDEKYNMQDISAEIKKIQDNLNIANIYLLG
ncbi:MAG: alpha/beta fold hydrolase, partial [Asgard group archaeon]|nr:alpha/beta fold hydrolase [Asgard group archaeon]